MDTATISVIVSGIVAVSGIFVTPITDGLKWSREQKAAEHEKLEKRTSELLESLALFRSNNSRQGVEDAARKQFGKAHTELLSRYYSWENAVMKHCKKDCRERLRRLQNDVENELRGEGFSDKTSSLIEEVLDIVQDLKI